MCRSTDFQRLYVNHRDCLKVKSFFVRLSNLQAMKKKLPYSLTLVYLPRINETALEISGKNIRSDSPAFVTLHRVITVKTEDGEVIYGSREPVVASEGVTFELYLGEEKVIKGIFRKGEDEWKLECKSVLEKKIGMAGDDVPRADVCVGLDGHVVMTQRVEMVVKMARSKRRTFCNGLQEIPEERETETDVSKFESDGCCSSCGDGESRSDGLDDLEEEINVNGVRWAVDVGIWVMCLGVGYLVSKASAKGLRRKTIF
ncbi:NADP-specific glutamate dehydrogenase [Melia azedarach]|uniref:NADP-specific glutamate dehydrogenase n=1 Tax=Melia azedarach TaxID=155640 RepID=A0ACC1XKZ1_MELAZ|nr:NADP-specific glutamate dehydrogenase [Melia azedarach]